MAVFSTKSYDRTYLTRANQSRHDPFIEARSRMPPLHLRRCPAVCAFVNDDLSERVLNRLADVGVCLIAMRSAGFNNVDLRPPLLGLTVVRVPAVHLRGRRAHRRADAHAQPQVPPGLRARAELRAGAARLSCMARRLALLALARSGVRADPRLYAISSATTRSRTTSSLS